MAKFTLMVETEDSAEIASISAAIADQAALRDEAAIAPVAEAPRTETKPRGRTKAQAEPAKEESAVEEIVAERGITAEEVMGDDPIKPITFEEVKAAMLDLIEKKDADVAKSILVKHGVTGRLGEASKEKYPELLAAFQAA